MKPSRLAAVVIATALTVGGTGCSRYPEVIDEIAPVAEFSPAYSVVGVDRPDASLASEPVVAAAAHSVVKVSTLAYSCQKFMEGSGFVVAPGRVMTNAHVVAGGDSVTVSVDEAEHDAVVVAFDPITDISVLNVPSLQAPPLDFARDIALTGTDALVLGYPGGGSFVAYPARIREVAELKVPDIYRVMTVRREVYTIRGTVGRGDSGGPLIDRHGRVLGMNFGSALHDPEVGLVLTAKQIYSHAVGSDASVPVSTGACMS